MVISGKKDGYPLHIVILQQNDSKCFEIFPSPHSDTTTADNHSDNSTCQDMVGAGNPRASQSKVKLAPTCPRVSVGGVIMIGACNIIVSTIWQSLAISGNSRHSHLFAGPPVVHGQLWQLGGKFSANAFLGERTRRPVSQTVAPADLVNSV